MDVLQGIVTTERSPQPRSAGVSAPFAWAAAVCWRRVGLGAILVLAGILDAWQLDRQGYGNSYYAAAVRSMLTGWHNFFFNAFDPGGFVAIDKPPLGFWIEAASARLFGFNGISLLLPQAVAGVLSVAVLYRLVARSFGAPAGLFAALALAVTPISVVGNRTNNIDSQLVLVVLLAAWAAIRATETGRLRWLLLTAVLLGLGFNVKMLQAYLVLPSCGLVYALAAPIRLRARIAHLAAATIVLLVASFWWVAAVDLTPAAQRPYVGSSCTNSELNLALGYNGLSRLSRGLFTTCEASGAGQTSAQSGGATARQGAAVPGGAIPGGGPGGAGENGAAEPLRLLNDQLGSQIGWLLPLAAIGLLIAALQTRVRGLFDRERFRLALDSRQQSLVLWGMWLLTQGIFFSVAGFFHTYYLVMLAPAVAALGGIGAVALWREYGRADRRAWLLPAALIGVALVQAHLLSPYPDYSRWLTPPILGLCAVAALALILARQRVHLGGPVILGAATAGMLSLLGAPITWAAYTAGHASSGALPQAGPPSRNGDGRFAAFGRFAGGAVGGIGAPLDELATPGRDGPGTGQAVDRGLLAYLERHQGSTTYLLAVASSMSADPYIIATGKPVMALGGFAGSDQILSLSRLQALIRNHTVRFFQLSAGGGFPGGIIPPAMLQDLPAGIRAQFERGSVGRAGGRGGFGRAGRNAALTNWVTTSCAPVPAGVYGSSGAGASDGGFGDFGGGGQLYDCANRPARTSGPAIGATARPTHQGGSAGSAAASPLPALHAALSALSGYRATATSTATGAVGHGGQPSAAMGNTETLTVLRTGLGSTRYTVNTRTTPFGTTTSETIASGGTICTRRTRSARFSCGTAGASGRPGTGSAPAPPAGGPGRAGGFGGPGGLAGRGFEATIEGDPSVALKGATLTPAGMKVIGGEACDGYAYTMTVNGVAATGTLYVARATHLPCERDATATRPSPMGNGWVALTTITRWGHFGDPGLTIPGVASGKAASAA